MGVSAARSSTPFCDLLRCLVLHTSGESEDLHTEQPTRARIKIAENSVFMLLPDVHCEVAAYCSEEK